MWERDRWTWDTLGTAPEPHGSISKAVEELVNAENTKDAESAYLELEDVVVSQGVLFPAAIGVAACLALGLVHATPGARPWLMRLAYSLVSGQEDASAPTGLTWIADRCFQELGRAVAIFLDLIETGTASEQADAIEVMGFLALRDVSLRPQVIWYLERFCIERDIEPRWRSGIQIWIDELKQDSAVL